MRLAGVLIFGDSIRLAFFGILLFLDLVKIGLWKLTLLLVLGALLLVCCLILVGLVPFCNLYILFLL